MTARTILSTAAALAVCCATALPVKWRVAASDAAPRTFTAYRGETVDFRPEFVTADGVSHGLSLTLCWQTNGMGAAWWTAPGATFTPAMDSGADEYRFFIRAEADGGEVVYRANGRLRMLPSPGFEPNAVEPPVRAIDFATVSVTNAPWTTEEWVADYVSGHAPAVDLSGKQDTLPKYQGVYMISASNAVFTTDDSGAKVDIALALASRPTRLELSETKDRIAKAAKAATNYTDAAVKRVDVSSQLTPIKDAVSSLGTDVESLSASVGAWSSYWSGDDVRVTVTNYYGNLAIPSLYIEQKTAADDDHDASWFKVIWDERTRWNEFLAGYAAVTNRVEQDLADRAWGVYDSATGAYSPDGVLQVSQDQIVVAPGMSWQKTVVSGGCAVWVLEYNEPTQFSGVTENGFFRIADGDGNALMEIVRGDKRTVGASASKVTATGASLVVTYAVESSEHPTLEVCADLKTHDWQTEGAATVASVVWSGSSGNWTATVTPTVPTASLFAKASYSVGGNTYVRYGVAQSVDKVVVGGVEYTVRVETMNGKKVMVLE